MEPVDVIKAEICDKPVRELKKGIPHRIFARMVDGCFAVEDNTTMTITRQLKAEKMRIDFEFDHNAKYWPDLFSLSYWANAYHSVVTSKEFQKLHPVKVHDFDVDEPTSIRLSYASSILLENVETIGDVIEIAETTIRDANQMVFEKLTKLANEMDHKKAV